MPKIAAAQQYLIEVVEGVSIGAFKTKDPEADAIKRGREYGSHAFLSGSVNLFGAYVTPEGELNVYSFDDVVSDTIIDGGE